jgi:hypothetical protein
MAAAVSQAAGEVDLITLPKKITEANAGGLRRLAIRTCWAARVAQFCRSWRLASVASKLGR